VGGQNLADLGAEVIKIERPGAGDDSRAFGPPWVKDRSGEDTGDSAYFTSANRGKKSVTVNIAAAEGQALVRELARRSDVLLENYKYGDLARYGLAYDDLRELNPGLIYCSVTGFGQTGPYRQRPGYDFMIQGMGGMMSVTGEPDDAPGGGPQRAGVPIADIITGMYASIAICAALAHRAETGVGQHLDLALLDSQIALLAYQNTNYFATGQPPKRIGNLHPNIVPYQPFRTKDGAVILACGNDNLFRKFCEASAQAAPRGRSALRDQWKARGEPGGADAPARRVFRQRTTAEWVDLLEKAGVPTVPSTISNRSTRSRRSWRAGSGSTSTTRWPASCRLWRARCASPARRSSTAAGRRCSENTRSRCCAACSAGANRRSRGCAPLA
jgi:crotonobetainyl-CoA:carnitine CoA-transferase CaiB-like acyl-CoA transferase